MKTALGSKVATEIIGTEEPVQISWDNARRRIVVVINLSGRDPGSMVAASPVAAVPRALPSGCDGASPYKSWCCLPDSTGVDYTYTAT